MNEELTNLCQKMLDTGKADADRYGYRWDNNHATYREIYAAFRAEDLDAAKDCWQKWFC